MAEPITPERLAEIIAKHTAWLRGDGGHCANLRGANLRGADLRDADLRNADLRGANLGNADLRDADLGNADLRDADLGGAYLRDAVLRFADLSDADLRGANLRGANLCGANLRGADLPTGYAIASLCFGGWPVTVTPTATTIGCRTYPNEQWLGWGVDAPEIAAMHDHAAAWWRRHREAVCAVIRDVMQPVEVSDG